VPPAPRAFNRSPLCFTLPSKPHFPGSLPLVSILAILWLWHDTSDAERIAAQAQSTFWYVLPTLPMFLVMPAMLRHGNGFWVTLAVCCVLTFALYLGTIWVLAKFGMTL
jgi:hypothetical protein